MGIRKHFEHESKEDTKLSDFSLDMDERQEGLVFDPEKDISAKDKKWFFDRIGGMRNSFAWATFLAGGAYLKTLFPGREEELHLDESAFEIIEDGLDASQEMVKKLFNPTSSQSFIGCMRDLRQCYPEKEYPLDPDLKKRLLKIFRTHSWHEPEAKAEIGANLKIWTGKPAEEFGITDAWWESAKSSLLVAKQDDNIVRFIKLAANLKIIHPEKADELDIDAEMWEKMKKVLHSYIELGQLITAMENAFYLKVLAAKRVRFTRDGMELDMEKPEDFKAQKNPRPERKSF